jgi:phosphatidate phosphatase APP1
MPGLKKTLTHSAIDAEHNLDMLKYRLRERLGGRRPLMILPYNGCGVPDRLYLKGRVLEDKEIHPAQEHDNLLANLLNTYKRAASSEIPYARVCARFQDIEQEVVADEEGFFEVWLTPAAPLSSTSLWQDIDLELLEPRRPGEPPAHAVGRVFIPPASASFGVISDIDDTVVQTGAQHLLRMASNILLGNAATRLPFKDVSVFYRALYQGPSGDQSNPLFFVSGSPWNLYDLLVDFFNLHGIPGGPLLFLRDWGLVENDILPIHNRQHKLGLCKLILNLFPHLPFILIGDSGQEDPEIYHEVVDIYPGRVKAVYIRSISRRPGRVEALQKLAAKVALDGSRLVFSEATRPMLQDAASQGWVSPPSKE